MNWMSRTKFDVAQANLMKYVQPSSSIASDNNLHLRPNLSTLNDDDLRLGLQGLDRAAEYRKKGQLPSALKLYELSIELLIRYLKNRPNDISEDTRSLERAIETALSDAEAIKSRMAGSGETNTAASQNKGNAGLTSTSPDSQSSTSSSFRSLSDALVTALRKKNDTSQPSVHPSSTKRTTRNSTAVTKNNHSIQKAQTHTTDITNSKVQNNSCATDEFYETVIAEFWIDPCRVQRTTWSDIAGLASCQQALQEAALLPLLRPDLCIGLRRPQHILLYGPPGTGKTMLVRAVAHESQSNLFVCTASALMSKWMGEAEKLIRKLFLVARDMVPAILFLDEIDALLGSRKSDNEHEASRRLKTEFMVQVDGITKPTDDGTGRHLLLIACTNCPWDVDTAVMRRFPRRIFVPLPDDEARRALLGKLLQTIGRHKLTAKQIATIVQRTEGFTCADITAIASEASFGPLRSMGGIQAIQKCKATDIRPVQIQDFEAVLTNGATKSVTSAQLQRYDDWQKQQQAG